MSLAVWPSAFIRFAVAMCSTSSTLRGRPNFVPFVRDAARFRAVRSLINSRSYSAREPRTPQSRQRLLGSELLDKLLEPRRSSQILEGRAGLLATHSVEDLHVLAAVLARLAVTQ